MTKETPMASNEVRAREMWAATLRKTSPKGEYAARTFEQSPSAADERVILAITAALSSRDEEVERLRAALEPFSKAIGVSGLLSDWSLLFDRKDPQPMIVMVLAARAALASGERSGG